MTDVRSSQRRWRYVYDRHDQWSEQDVAYVVEAGRLRG